MMKGVFILKQSKDGVQGKSLDNKSTQRSKSSGKSYPRRGKGNKPSKPKFSRRDVSEKALKVSDVLQATNDPKWYLEPNRDAVTSVSRFAFNLIPGYRSSLPIVSGGYSVGDETTFNPIRYIKRGMNFDKSRIVPGVIGFDWIPFMGSTSTLPEAQTAMNQSALNRFINIRRIISGSRTYEAMDLQLVTLAACQIYALLESAKKVYGLITIREFQNGCLPDDVILASGWDPVSVRSQGARFLGLINDVIAKMHNVWVPGDLPVVDRWRMLGKTILCDENAIRCQLYTFRQSGFYRYNPTLTSQSVHGDPHSFGGLEYVALDTALLTPDTWYNEITTAISRIVVDEAAATIMGDCLKAYGEARILTMDPVEPGYEIRPEFDPVMLTQIENMWMCPLRVAPPNIIQYVPADLTKGTTLRYDDTGFQYAGVPGLDDFAYLYSNSNDPTVEEIVEMTRFAKVIHSHTVYGGTEWVQRAILYAGGAARDTYESIMSVNTLDLGDTVTQAKIDDMNARLVALSNWTYFNKHPKLWLEGMGRSTTEGNWTIWTNYITPVGELYNAAAVDYDTINRHWEATAYNLWNVTATVNTR